MTGKFIFITLFLPLFMIGQNSISGKMEPDNDYTWILLYKMINGKHIYVKNAEVSNGDFEFILSENEESGVYRTYYQLENELFVEFLYNNEPVNFTFNPNNPFSSVEFLSSEENKLYQEYYKSISVKQKNLDSVQVAFFNSTDTKLDKKLSQLYAEKREDVLKTQSYFENKSSGKMANYFIRADKQHNAAAPIKIPEDYLNEVKIHFFDATDFNESPLINAAYINDKLIDYIFYLNQSNDDKALTQMQKEAIEIAINKIEVHPNLQKTVLENILNEYARQQNGDMVNYVLENYYVKLPNNLRDNAFRYEILAQVKTAVGNQAPNIIWEENGVSKDLLGLEGSDYYLVVFFSSTCNHCEKEIPELHNFTKDFFNLKVIAVGLEDEKVSWEKMVENLTGFTHILDLQKWDSERVNDYGIMAIPSYFLLDKDKNIIAKPENMEEINSMFNFEEKE